MRRRQFIASLPATALAVPLLGQPAQGSGRGGTIPPDIAPLPDFQAPGEERFVRPDIHAGDRPVGASFATRSAVYGTHGAGARF